MVFSQSTIAALTFPKQQSSFHVFFSFLGAQIVGINCHFDPEICVKAVKMMKAGVEKAGLKAHYMCQPLAYHTPDCNRQGFIDLPEFPFGMYKHQVQMFARQRGDSLTQSRM